MSYDSDNIFAKILKGEIPAQQIYSDDFALSFYDINPQAPVHALVIPKVPVATYAEFIAHATDQQVVGYHRAIHQTIALLPLTQGYRLIVNAGSDAVQEVPHLHTHILGGRVLGGLLPDGDR